MPRNPAWNREELILALDLYFRVGRKHEGPTHPDVIELSETLNALPREHANAESQTFRNPSGVAMKLGNFLSHDPQYDGKGLARGNRLEAEVWQTFASDLNGLKAVALAIREGIPEASSAPNVEDEDFPEGKVLTRIHKSRERNRRASEKKKARVLEETGRLACEACGFDFELAYGLLGRGFAECHHILPLAELPKRKSTTLEDLAILCANCHRMIHRVRPVVGINEFKSQLVALTKP